MLWSFAAACNFNNDSRLKTLAERAYKYFEAHFYDEVNKGFFWQVDYLGSPVNTRKQIYAQAFSVYSYAEYFKLSGYEQAKERAMETFSFIEKKARDLKENGYFEAFQKDWSPIDDVRLSEKDQNASKTMNTHLHILEAYTTLLQITGNIKVKEALENLVKLFLSNFLDNESGHYGLFFDEKWSLQSPVISFGHDIEAAWLLIEAAKMVGDSTLIAQTTEAAIFVADKFLEEAYVENKGVSNEKNLVTGKIDFDRHWWPQVEAMMGLHYAFNISGDKKYKTAILDIWNFTQNNLIDRQNGEWFFRVDQSNRPYTQDKLSMWKTPYHNCRTLMRLIKETQ
ncbi:MULTISPECIES: AGE family epimerase/isomerase [Salegentibacter]|uniref:AGE family epimerase/isomerase n=1 Tax=Salegentibacter TaxID=143222 RepID=UPI001E621BAF|nr:MULTISPECIES: AGE family epimerase/isomerase [Salegentibacter]